jgi:hypothetical protein
MASRNELSNELGYDVGPLIEPSPRPPRITATIVTTRCSNGLMLTRIIDDASGEDVAEITMTADQFAAQLSGSVTPGISIEWQVLGLRMIGRRREVKMETVMVDGRVEDRRAAAIKAIAEFEVDGWEGQVADAMNPHHRLGRGPKAPEDTARDGVIGDAYRVTFIRFVEADS